METIKGTYGEAVVYADDLDHYAAAQIKMICDNEAVAGSVIRVMPDVHPGKVGPIGLTMTVTERVLPSLVGVDIGCGVFAVKLAKFRPDFQKLDKVIRERIPSGFALRRSAATDAEGVDFTALACHRHIDSKKAMCSIGTLGGGNHFVEIDSDRKGNTWLVLHTGSRHLGKEVAEFYLREGQKVLNARGESVPYEMTYLDGALMGDYLHDVQIVQDFALLNRSVITNEIMRGMKWDVDHIDHCAHNDIAEEDGGYLLRKGAISAKMDEAVVIPANMRDGVILGIGKGNPNWNCSAPHGTGRIASREQVRNSHTLSEFKKEMAGIYSSCVGKNTLDEAPFAYRSLDAVKGAIADTVRVTDILKPLYSFKAGDGTQGKEKATRKGGRR